MKKSLRAKIVYSVFGIGFCAFLFLPQMIEDLAFFDKIIVIMGSFAALMLGVSAVNSQEEEE